jgi:hypothetical protein
MGAPKSSQQRQYSEQSAGHRRAGATTRTAKSDSWAEAIVTLLATVVFGLGWAIVELERANPPMGGYPGQSWTELALQRSNR